MKIYLILVLLALVPLAYSLECSPSVEPEDIPCQITSTWNYTAPCSNHKALVYNETGFNTANFTYIALNVSGRCYITWNITEKGSYYGAVTNGDTFNISVKVDNMQLGIILGIGITLAMMLWIAFKLEENHGILKLILIFFSVILIGLIPATFILSNISVILYKLIMGFIVVFWLYVAGYLIYWILLKLGVIVRR